ncbi:MAG: ATP-binding cassette domain-containing protein [Ferrimicrobium sp.]
MNAHDSDVAGIRATGFTKSYGTVRAVASLDVLIAPGETVTLLGPNEAGKSSTFDMILGLARPERGVVWVFGQDPRLAVRAGSVVTTLQTGSLLQYLSVRELVASLYSRPFRIDKVLELTGLAEVAGRQFTKLSGVRPSECASRWPSWGIPTCWFSRSRLQ